MFCNFVLHDSLWDFLKLSNRIVFRNDRRARSSSGAVVAASSRSELAKTARRNVSSRILAGFCRTLGSVTRILQSIFIMQVKG